MAQDDCVGGLTPYGVHMDMKGHNGGNMSMGKGSVYTTANKQKLVTQNSTECEVVGVHEVMPQLLWKHSFCKNKDLTSMTLSCIRTT